MVHAGKVWFRPGHLSSRGPGLRTPSLQELYRGLIPPPRQFLQWALGWAWAVQAPGAPTWHHGPLVVAGPGQVGLQ